MERVVRQAASSVQIEPVAVVHSCFVEKFGIPRQPGMVKSACAEVELLPPFNRKEMVRGLDAFSHLQLLFLFHGVLAEGWKPTVRPPRLGGRRRVGVFASRSPHRPNHLGLSAVRLDGIEVDRGVRLQVSGVDLLDQTPVVDIKPYIPYSDAIADADAGFTAVDDQGGVRPAVVFTDRAALFCSRYRKETGRELRRLITGILQCDPRPCSQRGRKSDYGMTLWDVNIRWRTEGDQAVVDEIERSAAQ